MNITTKLGGAAAATALALGTVTAFTGVQAQTAAAAQKTKYIKKGPADITLECCKCVDGREQAPIDISTGVAKWTVSKTATPPPPPPTGGYSANPQAIAVMPFNTSPQVVPGNIGPDPIPGIWTSGTGADWLQPTAAGSAPMYSGKASSYENGHYTYILKIRVPNCTIPQKVSVKGVVAADDLARIYMVGPGNVNQAVLTSPLGNFGSPTPFSADINLGANGYTKPGIYELRVEMDNLGGGPTGISLKGTMNSVCSRDLLKNPPKGKAAESDDVECPDCAAE